MKGIYIFLVLVLPIIRIVDAGHLMGAEQPKQVNTLITGFFEEWE